MTEERGPSRSSRHPRPRDVGSPFVFSPARAAEISSVNDQFRLLCEYPASLRRLSPKSADGSERSWSSASSSRFDFVQLKSDLSHWLPSWNWGSNRERSLVSHPSLRRLKMVGLADSTDRTPGILVGLLVNDLIRDSSTCRSFDISLDYPSSSGGYPFPNALSP